ncbi:MAG: DUF308 domain-containing protein [Candidatus Dormibacteraeota bacterium]|nr:DUF308 domain-containing protein [Candidatus Dormibacteraeota bacterium]
MSHVQGDITDTLRRVGGAWQWVLAFGAVGVAAGLCMFFFTGQALFVIAVTFGVWLIMGGVYRFLAAFSVPIEKGWLQALYAVLSMISVAIGAYLIAHPVLSLLVLTLTVGFFWIIAGMIELFAGVELRGMPHRGWLIFGGVVGVVAGWIIIFSPGISTLALALLLGSWLVVYGLTAVAGAIRLRALTRPARAILHARHV